MRAILAIAISVLTFGCTDTATPTNEAPSLTYETTGIPQTAFVGMVTYENAADLFYEPAQATEAQISAAPERVCAYFNGTVASAEDKPHPTANYYPTARVLEIKCTT